MNSAEPPRAFLEFFRRDMGGISRRILVPAGILVFCGAPGVCYGAAVKGSGALHLAVGVAGACVLLSGLFLGFIGMARLVRHDAYLAVVEDGLVIHLETAGDAFYSWETLRSIAPKENGLALELGDASVVAVEGRFGGLDPKTLAERLEDWRRKALFKLKPSNPPPAA